MPQVFKIGSYVVYFWMGEGEPLEPVHVHISKGTPTAKSTKIWITKSGNTIVANNDSQIPPVLLRKLCRMIEANTDKICDMWKEYFEQLNFYC